MQMQILILSILTFYANLYTLGSECDSKAILSGNSLIEDTYADCKKAFNGYASCISLRSDDESLCCYIKVKFKNKQADKKFTHKGCIQLGATSLQDVKATTKYYEQALENDESQNFSKVDVSIDCNSKFIKLTGLLLLAFLL